MRRCGMNIETQQPGKVGWCKACGAEYVEKHACGPFVVRETYGGDPDGKTYYVAVHEPTGFAFTGRASRGEASSDARIGNAVLRLALANSNDGGESDRAQAWGSVANTLSRVMPNWYTIANTGERSAVCAIERMAEEARASKEIEARERGLSMATISGLRDKLRAAREALKVIGWEPLGDPEATPARMMELAGELARKTYGETGGAE